MNPLHLLTGLAEIMVAIALWHRAAPALRCHGHWRAWKTWLLGVALALLGIGQLDAWWSGATVPLLRQLGDAALIAYSIWRFVHIMRHVPPPHWSEAP